MLQRFLLEIINRQLQRNTRETFRIPHLFSLSDANMQLPSILSITTLLTTTAALTVSYDKGYDLSDRSLNDVACSDGENGLITRFGWSVQGDASNFPNIGGAPAVEGWNSPECGSCWELKYDGNTVNILAVDVSIGGYVVSLTAMDELTRGLGEQLGRVEVDAKQVEDSVCGIVAEEEDDDDDEGGDDGSDDGSEDGNNAGDGN